MSREAEIAWAAGLFEGEGCISIRPRPRALGLETRLSLSTTDYDVLERFAQVVGSGSIGGQRQREPHHKPIWRWSEESTPRVIRILTILRPYLGERRGMRADQALDAAWTRIARRLLKYGKPTLLGVRVRPQPWAQLTAALGEE